MWKVFPMLGLLKLVFTAFSALLLAVLVVFFEYTQKSGLNLTWGNFGQAFEMAAPVAILFIGIVYIIGKWIWKVFWKIPWLNHILNKHVCPDLNGIWSGHTESNYPNNEGNRTKKDVEVKIKADIFGFSIFQKSLDGYQSSKVVQSEIYRDSRTNTFYISYIYEANVPDPEETDDRHFEGAGKLEVKFDGDLVLLEGTFWTNRAWQRKKNTAGIIKLARKGT